MKKTFFSLLAALYSFSILAQDNGGGKDINVNINTKGSGGAWYASPWVWVVGAAVFILLLVALTRSGGSRTD
ncbi:MAG TPA: hypothetical protein VNS32_18000 [Flavisolibacter sp.]|nr:hypothetical protein [Flavisolibacter sp.]